MSILFSFHWCCHTPPVWPPSSPLLLLLDALPDTCNPLTPWTARQCTGRVVEAGVDTISSSPFPRLRMWTLSASVLVKRLFFSVRTDSALFRYLPGDEPVLWGGVHVDINCLCSHGDEVLVTPLAWPDQTRGGRGEVRRGHQLRQKYTDCTQHHFPLKKRKLKPTLVENRTDFIERQRTEAPARSLSWPHFLDLE